MEEELISKVMLEVMKRVGNGNTAVAEPEVQTPPRLAGVPAGLPVNLYVPGCPPHPLTLLDGLLRLLDRLPTERAPTTPSTS